MRRIENKRCCHMIDRWPGAAEFEKLLNAFIEKIELETTNDIMHELSKHWRWEYAHNGTLGGA